MSVDVLMCTGPLVLALRVFLARSALPQVLIDDDPLISTHEVLVGLPTEGLLSICIEDRSLADRQGEALAL
jgi:hypothetical protein